MKKIYFNILIVLLFLNIPFWTFEFINVGVSLKYEINEDYECISYVTGKNLCLMQNIATSLTIISFVILVILLYFRKRIIN
jgi:ABC-type Mn2+/Zn2+ transport system permease subunit